MQTRRIPVLTAGLLCLGLVAACAPQPAPQPMLSPQPSFNKLGQLQDCGAGYMVRGQQCLPYEPERPGDECTDPTNGREVPCPPTWRDPDPDRDPDPGRDPSGDPGRGPDPTGGLPDPQ